MRKFFLLFALLFASVFASAEEEPDKLGPDGLSLLQLKTLAANGDAYYQAALSNVCRQGGLGAPSDYSSAVAWASLSVEAKNPLGLYALAALLDGGLGVQADKAKAEELFKESAPGLKALAEAGDFRASYAYAYLLYSGRGGVAQDKSAALELFRKAAEAGDPNAAYMTGTIYQRGDGVERSVPKAMEWLMKGAEAGDPKSQRALGFLYLKSGMGGNNKQEAVRWIIMAAEAGDAEGQYLAGLIFEAGNGVPKDMSKALQYYHRSALQGDEMAKKRLKSFADNLRKTMGVEKEDESSPAAKDSSGEAAPAESAQPDSASR